MNVSSALPGHRSYDLTDLKIMVIEHSESMQSLLKQMLKSLRVTNFLIFDSGKAAMAQFKEFDPDMMIVSWRTSDVTGLQVVNMVRKGSSTHNPYIPVIVTSALTSVDCLVQARDAGIHEFLAKPMSPASLYKKICYVIEHQRPFVRVGEAYFGPDRRRKDKGFIGTNDRRSSANDDSNAITAA